MPADLPPIEISGILSPDRVLCDASVSSKKAALETLADLIASADPEISRAEVFGTLITREKLGSTGLGHGIALPHGRRKGGTQAIAAFLRLKTGIPYDAIDRQPVDLLFALLVPEASTEEHLQILSRLATLFNDSRLVDQIRAAETPDAVFSLLTR